MSGIAARLAAPQRRLNLEALARDWFMARITVRLPGYALLAHDLGLLRRLRGAVGNVLLEGASPEAIAGRPCPWDPPCALDILFREQGRGGAFGIPKPYLLAALRHGGDLLLVMTLFGFAAEWAPIAGHALAVAVQHRIDWRGQRPEIFLRRPAPRPLSVRAVEGLPLPPWRAETDMVFLTPMNGEGDDPFERPATVVARLARRVEGLARWQDAAIDTDWRGLAGLWEGVSYDLGQLRRVALGRRSGRARRDFTVDGAAGVLRLGAVPTELWPLLVIGAETHVGKGASEGFGRYLLA